MKAAKAKPLHAVASRIPTTTSRSKGVPRADERSSSARPGRGRSPAVLRETPVWETAAVIVGPFGTSQGFTALPGVVPPVLPAAGSMPQRQLSASSSLRSSLRQSGSIRLKVSLDAPVWGPFGSESAAGRHIMPRPEDTGVEPAPQASVGSLVRQGSDVGALAARGSSAPASVDQQRSFQRRVSMLVRDSGVAGGGQPVVARRGSDKARQQGPVWFRRGVPGGAAAVAGHSMHDGTGSPRSMQEEAGVVGGGRVSNDVHGNAGAIGGQTAGHGAAVHGCNAWDVGDMDRRLEAGGGGRETVARPRFTARRRRDRSPQAARVQFGEATTVL